MARTWPYYSGRICSRGLATRGCLPPGQAADDVGGDQIGLNQAHVDRHIGLSLQYRSSLKLKKFRERAEALDSVTGVLEAWIYPGSSRLMNIENLTG